MPVDMCVCVCVCVCVRSKWELSACVHGSELQLDNVCVCACVCMPVYGSV